MNDKTDAIKYSEWYEGISMTDRNSSNDYMVINNP